jgi:hypothetical protein
MTEDLYRRWEVALKAVAIAGLAIGGVVGVAEYLHTAARESQKPFLEKQLAFCAEATGAAAILATSQDEAARARAKDLFLEMYWGRLGIVEDVRVTQAMINYRNVVIEGDKGANSDPPPVLALKIGFACRDLTLAAWQIRLPPSVQLPHS